MTCITNTYIGHTDNCTTNQSTFVPLIRCLSSQLCAEAALSMFIVKHKGTRPILIFELLISLAGPWQFILKDKAK